MVGHSSYQSSWRCSTSEFQTHTTRVHVNIHDFDADPLTKETCSGTRTNRLVCTLDVNPRVVHVDKGDFDTSAGDSGSPGVEHEDALPLMFEDESDRRAQEWHR